MSMKKESSVAADNLRALWEARKHELKLTQTEAAAKLGWTQGALAQYLNNLTELTPPAVIKLANFFGVDPREIDPAATGTDFPCYVAFPTKSGDSVTVDLQREWIAATDDKGVITLTPPKK